MTDKPAYTSDRFMRCVAHYIRHRATALRHPEDRMARALAAYWEHECWKAAL